MLGQTIRLRREWKLGKKFDEGGFGFIFEATADDGSPAVVKLIPKDPGAERELLFEVVPAGAKNVLPILDSGEHEDFYALVMPRAEISLKAHLEANGGKLPVDEAVVVLGDVAEALESLEKTIVHRDLKPGNILRFQGRWCLSDFGIARYAEASTARDTRKFSMSPPYAAPEQWRGEHASPATDIYAFGVSAYEILQGEWPFAGPRPEDFRNQHLHDTAPTLSGVPTLLAGLVSECLYKASGARPTAANLRRRLATSQQPPSPAAARLQAMNQKIVESRAADAAKASAQQSAEDRRKLLLATARQSFSPVIDLLVDHVRHAAPAASIDRKGCDVTIRLGSASLGTDDIIPVIRSSDGSPKLPFDVVAFSAIGVRQPPDRFGHAGRAHSLWYCDAHDAGVYRWYELAFMIGPFHQERSRVNPFSMKPLEAEEAFRAVVGRARQVAWQPVPIDQGEEAPFVERWLGWFAEAVEGTLMSPRHQPEDSGGRHR